MPRAPVPIKELHDLRLLLTAHHPVIFLESVEDDRVSVLLEHASEAMGMPYYQWTANRGLSGLTGTIGTTQSPAGCIDYIRGANSESVYHLKDFGVFLDELPVLSRIKEAAGLLGKHRGAMIITGDIPKLPASLDALVTRLRLSPPSDDEYFEYLRALLRDIRSRLPVRVDIDADGMQRVLQRVRGLTLFELKKIITTALIETQLFDDAIADRIVEAKKEAVARTGVLEYFPTDTALAEVAGLANLKTWLQSRHQAFVNPDSARSMGLEPPRGLFLVGVQGCGKSLCAKAVAAQWHLPLLRLDPSRLYNMYVGETEKNLQRAMETAEAMAPTVLWIDEIEKALASGSREDSGTSQRILGTFLTWLQEKPPGVFVVATSNDISKLPPELLRKGRFDEIFFVDLPDPQARRAILELHLGRRNQDPKRFDITALADLAWGFSGAELEQAIVGALYRAFSTGATLATEHLREEIDSTVPLSRTMYEAIEALRAWADGRTVPAG